MKGQMKPLAADVLIPAGLVFGPSVAAAQLDGPIDPSTPAPAGIDPTIWFLAISALNVAIRFGLPWLYKVAVDQLRKLSNKG